MRFLSTTTARLVIILGVLVAACGDDSADAAEGTGQTTVSVFAAASLTDAFGELASAFEVANPDVNVELNLAGSSSLRSQILDGAPVDVFASASEQVMAQVIDGGAISAPPETFATNRLTIAVPTGNPGDVDSIADFERADLFIGLCNPEVPCGALAATDLAAAGVDPAVDSFEPDVRALLTKIAAGELDAGLVYVTDVQADDAVLAIDPAAGVDPTDTFYPIAVVDNGPAGPIADRFVEFVLGPDGQAILDGFGFGTP